MSWMLSICVATALLALCRGQNTVHEGNSLSASGYRLCIHNETRNVSFLVMHTVPYTVTKPCGGWLHWNTCTVTLYRMTHQTKYKTVMEQVTRCCTGYVQVGRYCALPVNRSDEFTAKPGSCPTADGLYTSSEDCEWDSDCPGWQKCCQKSGRYFCSDPASSANYSVNGGYRFNATLTVKTDYQQLMSSDRGHLNHTRLLQAMVTGALQSDVSVYYLSSQPVHPFRTATSLLIDCNFTLSLYNVTSKLHLLLKHIQEVSSVTVEDVDECSQSALRQCSPQADCNNTVGSYHCACHQGYIDVDPSNPGAQCTADVGLETTKDPQSAYLPPMNTTYTSASNSTQDPLGNNTVGIFSSTETSMTTALSNTSTVAYNSPNASQWTSSATYSSSTVESPLLTTTCSPPSITSVWSTNVTGFSICVHWSSQFQTNQTYQVVLSKRSEVIHSRVTNQSMMEVRELHPGVLYNVTVTPRSCGSQGVTLHISVKTDAQTLDATARLTNIQFTADLQNTSSYAFENLTMSIREEIYQSLSPGMKAMVDSGQVRIEIRSFSLGSVMVNFTFTYAPSQSQDISNVSTALLHSLMNSIKYTVDINNTSTNDFDECASGENDCSQWSTCINTWASYTCDCLDGFIDNNPERPGRACKVVAPTTTPTAPTTTTTAPTTTTTAPTTTITAPTTTTTTPATTPTAPATTPTAPTTTTTTPATTPTAPATTPTAPTTTTTAPTTTTTAPATTPTAPATILTAPTTTTTDPTTTPTALATTITAPTTTPTAPTSTATAPATTPTAPTTTTTAPTTTTTAPTTTITVLAITTTAPTTTPTAPTTTPTAPATTTSAPTTTITAPQQTTTVAPTTTTTAPATTPTAPTTTTTAPTTTTTAPTTTITALAITTTAPTTTPTAPTTTPTAPATTTSAPTTTITAPTTTTVAPTTTHTAPTTTITAATTTITPPIITITPPTTTITAPTIAPTTTITASVIIIPAPITTTIAPTTTTASPTISAISPTISAIVPTTTTSTMLSMTSSSTTTVTNPTTTITASRTTTTALRNATHALMLGAISVQCRVAAITVTVSRDFLLSNKIRESTLYLGLPECVVNGGNAIYAQLTVAWNECGTSLVHV
ncbi:uromodulin-like 1 isoform X2 [Cottoperca gobio]|uniref:Uromodulin-like 1 isoform X2 n=1 Tax=Cottoperca gobio TaxID=56716 RepID=A0A6J2R202_COTGO|nr:uromodulin-like 1 isoform X2 [Cottoperca gobio]